MRSLETITLVRIKVLTNSQWIRINKSQSNMTSLIRGTFGGDVGAHGERMCEDRQGRAQERDLGRTHPADTLISDVSLGNREGRTSVVSAPT